MTNPDRRTNCLLITNRAENESLAYIWKINIPFKLMCGMLIWDHLKVIWFILYGYTTKQSSENWKLPNTSDKGWEMIYFWIRVWNCFELRPCHQVSKYVLLEIWGVIVPLFLSSSLLSFPLLRKIQFSKSWIMSRINISSKSLPGI